MDVRLQMLILPELLFNHVCSGSIRSNISNSSTDEQTSPSDFARTFAPDYRKKSPLVLELTWKCHVHNGLQVLGKWKDRRTWRRRFCMALMLRHGAHNGSVGYFRNSKRQPFSKMHSFFRPKWNSGCCFVSAPPQATLLKCISSFSILLNMCCFDHKMHSLLSAKTKHGLLLRPSKRPSY